MVEYVGFDKGHDYAVYDAHRSWSDEVHTAGRGMMGMDARSRPILTDDPASGLYEDAWQSVQVTLRRPLLSRIARACATRKLR